MINEEEVNDLYKQEAAQSPYPLNATHLYKHEAAQSSLPVERDNVPQQ